MRPVMKPALRQVWRDATTLQIGLDPERALVMSGVSASTAHLIASLDGTHDVDSWRANAVRLGFDHAAADHLLTVLDGAHVLDDAATDTGPLATLPLAERERLGPDLASASLVYDKHDAGLSTIGHRQAAAVTVIGGGRVGAATATLLAAAGVGRVVVDDPARSGPGDCVPGGISPDDVGSSRGLAAHAAINRASTSTRTDSLDTGSPNLVVIAPTGAVDTAHLDDLTRAGTPHLLATIRETTGIVGPFVMPGASACRRCLDLHRRDRDPGWPIIAAQLATDSRRNRPASCDVVLASQVASICAAQALSYLDGNNPATWNATLEVRLPDWRVRRRSWRPHPSCGCHWPSTDPEAPAPGTIRPTMER